MRISIIGSGNVAGALARRIHSCGHQIDAVFSRDYEKAEKLASRVGAKPLNSLSELPNDSDIYLLAVKDDAIAEVAAQIISKNAVIAHTSGATAMSVFEGIHQNFGVFYPLQTFSAEISPDFLELPLCISGNNEKSSILLERLAASICPNVYSISEAQRKGLHVAAVFVNNFSNFLYSAAYEICNNESLNFDMLKPLIRQTVRKIEIAAPTEIQTGPARRGDEGTLAAHLQWLDEHAPEYSLIYSQLSDAILNKYKK